MNNTQNHKIPLVLGITGHRDIDQSHISKLEERITEIFDSLIAKYPNTPLILLTPLADGADRIIANVVLRDKYKDKITISVPLPMDEENYKDTFAKGITEHKQANEKEKQDLEEGSKKEFDDLIEKVKEQKNEYVPKTIPMLFDQKAYEKASEDEQRQLRRKQYSIVGEYIAIHSHILIALYDEIEYKKYNFDDCKKISQDSPGGTLEVVCKKRTGKYEHFKVKDEDVTYPETGIVFAIATPKGLKESHDNYQIKQLLEDGKEVIGLNHKESSNNSWLKLVSYKISTLYDRFKSSCLTSKDDKELILFEKHFKTLDCFNLEVEKDIKDIEKKSKEDISNLTCCKDKLIYKNMMMRRSTAFLARKFQNKMQIIEKYILILIGITIFIAMVQSNFGNFTYSNYLDPLYLILVVLFYGTYTKFKTYKKKHEDYRSLSEALRVQTAWKMTNINDSVALHYLSHQKNELGWIRSVARGINIFYLPKHDAKFEKEQVNNYWLNEQIDYFKNNIKSDIKIEKSISQKIKFNFFLFLFFTTIFSILSFTTNADKCTTMILGFTLFDILKLIFMGVPFVIATYLKSKQYFDGNDDKLREYELSLDIFTRAKKLLCDDSKNAQQVYKNLGKEALRENSSWIISRRAKDYEIS